MNVNTTVAYRKVPCIDLKDDTMNLIIYVTLNMSKKQNPCHKHSKHVNHTNSIYQHKPKEPIICHRDTVLQVVTTAQ